MENQNTKQAKKKKVKPLKLTLVIIVVVLAALAVTALVAVPAYISSDSGRETILAKINQAVEGKTDFDSLSMGWLKGIKITDFSYDDEAGFASVQVKHISTIPHYSSLLGGNISLGRTVIDQPRVNINLQNRPVSEPDEEKNQAQPKESTEFPVKKIDLYVNDGDIVVSDSKNNAVHLANVNSHVDLVGTNRLNQFAVDMTVADGPEEAKLNAEGAINPAKVSGNVKVQLDGLDIAKLAPLFDLAEIQIDAKGKVTANIETQFADSKLQKLSGTLDGSALDISGAAFKGDRLKTESLKLDAQLKRSKDLMDIEKLTLSTDWADVKATGQIPTTFDSLSQFISPEADYALDCDIKVDLSQTASQMPNTFKLQPGTKITSGTLTAKINSSTTEQKRQITANASVTELAGIVNAKPISLSQPIEAQALITSVPSGINYDRIQVSSSFAQIKCSGTEKLLAYEASADLAKLQNELGQFVKTFDYRTAGQLLAKGKLTSNKDSINLTGSTTIDNLVLTSAQGQAVSEPKATVNMDIDIIRKVGDLDIKTIDLTASFGNVKIAKGFLPSGDGTKKNFSVPIAANVDLQKAEPFARLASAYPQKLKLAGLLNSNLNISGNKDNYRILTNNTTIKNLSIATPGTKPLVQELVTVNLDSQISPNNKTIKCKLDGKEIKIDADIKHLIKNNDAALQAKADCDYNWQFISRALSAFMPQGLAIEGQNKTTIELASKYPADKPEQLWANLNAKPLKIGFDKAQYLGFVANEPSQVEIQFNDGVLTIPQFSIKVNEGTLNFAGTADFKQTPTLFTMKGPQNVIQNVKVDERVSSKLLQYLNPIFKDADRVRGIASFSAKILEIPLKGASKKDLNVDGTFSVSDMQLASPIFSVLNRLKGQDYKMQLLPTVITVKEGLVRYDNMQLNVGENPFNFVGRIDLITRSIEGSKAITPYTTGPTIKTGQENTPGRITLPFTGTIDNPKVDLGKTLIETGLQEILKGKSGDNIGEDLEKIGDILKNL
ncbi:MAG: DUF748 domain-containing protein [Sedimentisphaerales bacterium]|nr:DUF748 domain-containing protein [Sedimentisphaerales bacterium]